MTSSRGEEQATRAPQVALPAEAVRSLNAQPAINRPKDAEAPSRFSADHATHAVAYAFLVGNPAATAGALQVGRQHWLEYGVLSQPFHADGGNVYAVIDEWNVARRFCKLEFASTAQRDVVNAVRISDIPCSRGLAGRRNR